MLSFGKCPYRNLRVCGQGMGLERRISWTCCLHGYLPSDDIAAGDLLARWQNEMADLYDGR